MKISLFALTSFAAIALTSAAQAQDVGPRLEARAGYAMATADGSPDLEGAVYGVAAGYDFAFGQGWFAGVDAGIEWQDASAAETAGNTTTEIKLGQTVELGGRIGAFMQNGASVYARAAYVMSDVEGAITVVGTTGTTRTTFEDDMDGIRFAVGGSYPLGDRFRVTGEVRHSMYDDLDQTGVTVGLAARF